MRSAVCAALSMRTLVLVKLLVLDAVYKEAWVLGVDRVIHFKDPVARGTETLAPGQCQGNFLRTCRGGSGSRCLRHVRFASPAFACFRFTGLGRHKCSC